MDLTIFSIATSNSLVMTADTIKATRFILSSGIAGIQQLHVGDTSSIQ